MSKFLLDALESVHSFINALAFTMFRKKSAWKEVTAVLLDRSSPPLKVQKVLNENFSK